MDTLFTGPDALLLAPECMPFTVALGLMLAIGLLEGVGLVLGMGFSHLFDSLLPEVDLGVEVGAEADVDPGAHADVASHGALARLLGWLNFGRVPALIVLIVWLLAFGFAGLALQEVARAALGSLLPTAVGVLVALLAAAPLTKALTGAIARAVPKDETEAVSRSSFVGRDATLLQAAARAGQPAQAKLKDVFGQTHYIMVEPESDDVVLEPQSQVVILRQKAAHFVAAPRTE